MPPYWLIQIKINGGTPHSRSLALGSIVVGLSIALGWFLTQAIASQSFEAVQIQGLSFSSASAEMLMRVLSSATSPSLGFDAGLLPATFVGSLLGALVGGDFKFEGFKTENKLGHYLTGAVLMGFGAVLAGGARLAIVTLRDGRAAIDVDKPSPHNHRNRQEW